MYYHAKIEYPGVSYGDVAVNLTREQLIRHVAIPFIAGQVTDVPLADGVRMVNMRTVSTVLLYQTEDSQHRESFYAIHQDEIAECTQEILRDLRSTMSSADVRSTIERTFSPNRNQAFVVMRFGDDELNSTYELAIAPALRAADIEPVRIDQIENSGRITDQILNEIAASRLVVADLSGERPNCYYETGFAHALGKDLILCVREGDDIHFDLAANRFIVWRTPLDLRERLTSRLKALSHSPDSAETLASTTTA